MFTPIGDSQVIPTNSAENTISLTGGTHVRIVCVNDKTDQETWRIGFFGTAVNAPRFKPGSVEEPLVFMKPPGAVSLTIRGITPNETCLVTCGNWDIEQPFDPASTTIQTVLTKAPTTVALPVGTRRVRLALDQNRVAGKMYVKFGSSGVVCNRATGMPCKEPTFADPLVVGVPVGATHISVMGATSVGNTLWIDPGAASAIGTGRNGIDGINGIDGLPAPGGSSPITLIETVTANAINTDISLPAGYKGIRIVGKALTVSVDAVALTARLGASGVFPAAVGNYDYNLVYCTGSTLITDSNFGPMGDTYIPIVWADVGTGVGIGNAANEYVDFDIEVWRHTETGKPKALLSRANHILQNGFHAMTTSGGTLKANTNPIDALRLSLTSGVLSGPIYVYGYA